VGLFERVANVWRSSFLRAGCEGLAEDYAGPLTVGRGRLFFGYFLLLRQKKVTKEKATPLIPATPKTEPAGWEAKNSPRFCWVDLIFVSGTQTPLPLIHPPDSISGGAERGESQNQGGDDWAV